MIIKAVKALFVLSLSLVLANGCTKEGNSEKAQPNCHSLVPGEFAQLSMRPSARVSHEGKPVFTIARGVGFGHANTSKETIPDASTQALDNLTLSIDDGSQLYSDLLANGCSGTSVSSTITLEAPSSLEKGITFTLSVPVRRVLFLEWLNLLQSNPEAGIPYKDEILTASGKLGPYYKDGDVLRFPA